MLKIKDDAAMKKDGQRRVWENAKMLRKKLACR